MSRDADSFGTILFFLIMAVIIFIALVVGHANKLECEARHCEHGKPTMTMRDGCLCVEQPEP